MALSSLIGELFRYGEADTSLMMVDNVVSDPDWGIRVYGAGCMGGRVGANIEDLMVEMEEDWFIWDSWTRIRDAGNRRRRGET